MKHETQHNETINIKHNKNKKSYKHRKHKITYIEATTQIENEN